MSQTPTNHTPITSPVSPQTSPFSSQQEEEQQLEGENASQQDQQSSQQQQQQNPTSPNYHPKPTNTNDDDQGPSLDPQTNFAEESETDSGIESDSDSDDYSMFSVRGAAATKAALPPSTPVTLTPQEIRSFPNYAFQTLNMPSKPDNVYLTHMHKHWNGNFQMLEVNHAYIQWLFPLFEPGMNRLQPPMTQAEADLIAQNTFAKQNMIKSFHMMLDFWGFKYDPVKNIVSRHDDIPHMEKMFDNWMCSHNDLRVTRCMKSLYATGQKDPAMAFLRQLHFECSPQGFPRGRGLRMALDKFWLTIFENDPLFQAECQQLRAEMNSWKDKSPARQARGFFNW